MEIERYGKRNIEIKERDGDRKREIEVKRKIWR